ncbi:prokineticin domain-containing protein [Caerostris darwini]|uniref:Prokineticin domain-containing protein n=1 Tax=Caerostris darwini TaxID=1538125 RepID=A0AAV4T4N3_9ARAC|nr:prokineticin domain-containing protein [Caerostris darwini]
MSGFYVCLILFPLLFSCAMADGMRSCITDESCEEGECCISMAFLRGFCHTLGDEGDHCITEPAKTEYGNKNLFGCPCKQDFKCIPEIIHEEDGKTIMKNFACKKSD